MNTKLDELFIQARDEVFMKLNSQPDGASKLVEMQTFGAKVINECLEAVKTDAHAVQLIKTHFNIPT